MKNIWKIFTGDLKKLVKQPFALVIIIGLCVIPSLYAWFNIFANWDPYANTGGIPVAVVSLDQDYTLKDGSVVNMGESVLESLHSNTSLNGSFWIPRKKQKRAWKPENIMQPSSLPINLLIVCTMYFRMILRIRR